MDRVTLWLFHRVLGLQTAFTGALPRCRQGQALERQEAPAHGVSEALGGSWAPPSPLTASLKPNQLSGAAAHRFRAALGLVPRSV